MGNKLSARIALPALLALGCGCGDPGTGRGDGSSVMASGLPGPTPASGSAAVPAESDASGALDDVGTEAEGGGSAEAVPDLACGNLVATVRDFPSAHQDMEFGWGSVAYTGLVEPDLDSDGKPVFASAPPLASGGAAVQINSAESFDQWYRDLPGVNEAFEVEIPLQEDPTRPGVFVFDSADPNQAGNPDGFFPIDGRGFGDEGQTSSGRLHNFHFTTELSTSFVYRGGEVFEFRGDDDLWLFINGRLAIDLGGLHPALTGQVDLDSQAAELGIEAGQPYGMHIFHAERHTDESNFRIETTIDCFQGPI